MSWVTAGSLDQATNVSATEVYPNDSTKGTGAITLNPHESCVMQFNVDFQGTPTEGLIVNVYTTLDDSSEVWDNQPYQSFLVPHNNPTEDPKYMTVVISGVYKFCVGYQTGGTDQHTSVDCDYRKNGVSA